MIGIDIGILLITVACLASTYRMLRGPTEADRAIAGDLLLFGVVGLVALFGVRAASTYTFDIVLITALVGFLGALSLARALTRGKR
ncbi:multicomponent Na+:H+ antiporter subunit F [Tamaricihabitans halophyticus]|uniref:Multicomponent Na+:H+ antiporter subunit F n=1 Tax=Tamaricihabitans halophyticus TaxID=1262583 RepID=A0A4V2SU26_9PSEU|nr:monovalent cation/H+ antiporter complex subunit F [Tamaricihabitans halophyticus]TCP52986.1 multicomponent Na+:H+ antiporter subunit F [Tamaricihabitans halophyticus]